MTAPILGQTANIFTSSFEDSSKPSNEYGAMQAHTYAITMTSLELVQFINSQRDTGAAEIAHSDFLKKAPHVLGGGVGKFSDTYVHPQNGQTYPCYRFPKREACLMAMSYSYDIQAKVFDRMTALESSAPAFTIPTTLSAALRLAADQSEQIDAQKAQLAIAAPKVAALDLISAGKDAMTVTEASKVLGMKRKDLTSYLNQKGWIYRQNGSWVAYDAHIKTGSLQYKEASYTDDKTGMVCKKPYCHITPKGMTKLAMMIQ